MTIIRYTPLVVIKNAGALPAGLGAKYLECIVSHNGDLVAKQWRRTVPAKCEVLIKFGK